MRNILGIGNALVDVMTLIDSEKILERFSLPKGSMQLVDAQKSAQVKEGTSGFRRTLTSGGSAANTIHGLAMLGCYSGFIGSIGRDETGDFFESEMQNAGVRTFLLRRKTQTGTAVALITPDSERTFATHLGAAVELGKEDLDPVYFSGFDILYLEGYLIIDKALTEEACRIAKLKNMEIAIDLASYNVVQAKLDDFKEIVTKYADIIFANEDEARAYTGYEPDEALKTISEQCRIAVVKTGSRGSLVRSGSDIYTINPLPVNCVDTTGAGDLYAAGFLHAYSQGFDLNTCGDIGALLAATVIETVGAKINPLKWPVLKKIIAEKF